MPPSHFTLLLSIPSCFTCCYLLFRTSLIATYSFFYTSPNYYLLLPLCFTLQLLVLSFTFSPYYLPTPSFMFHPTTTCSLLYISPYHYLLLPLCITPQLLVFSFLFCFATYLLLRISSCCFYHKC